MLHVHFWVYFCKSTLEEQHSTWISRILSCAKEPYKRDYILQKRPTFLRSLLTNTYKSGLTCERVMSCLTYEQKEANNQRQRLTWHDSCATLKYSRTTYHMTQDADNKRQRLTWRDSCVTLTYSRTTYHMTQEANNKRQRLTCTARECTSHVSHTRGSLRLVIDFLCLYKICMGWLRLVGFLKS